MRKKRKYFPAFVISIILFILFILFVIYWSPNQSFVIVNFSISAKLVFFALIFSSTSLIASFLFSSYTRGALSGSFITITLLLRFLGFNNIFYPALLAMLTILIDRLLSRRS